VLAGLRERRCVLQLVTSDIHGNVQHKFIIISSHVDIHTLENMFDRKISQEVSDFCVQNWLFVTKRNKFVVHGSGQSGEQIFK
jgi:hypothetical protein